MKLFENYAEAHTGWTSRNSSRFISIIANWPILESYQRNYLANGENVEAIFVSHPHGITISEAKLLISELSRQVEFFETQNKVIDYNEGKR